MQLWIMCSRDLLFYINTFCFTYDPRRIPKITELPFITYDYQDVAFDDILLAITNKYDQLTEKSRDMGASWMYLMVFLWYFVFVPFSAFRLLSRNENLVDKDEDPDCLFWKILFTLKRLPRFLQPEYNYVHLHIKNLDNEATLGGYTIVKDAVRQIKKTSKEVFMPLSQRPGEAQVDFGHALANFGGTLKKIVFFVMSLAHSDAMFVNLPRFCCSASVR